jgi:sugar phosphate isomerase/epimerase
MEIIFFTKFMRGLSAETVGVEARALGVDGLDLAVRAEQCVSPDNFETALPEAMAIWRDMGLSVPMVTMETSWGDPAMPEVERLYAACGGVGIPHIKLGYWRWEPTVPYWHRVEEIRHILEQFRELSVRYGVTSLVHTHSGLFYGCNASSVVDLVGGFSPDEVAVYLDPAHLAADGEQLPMALSIVGNRLRMVAVKNLRYVHGEDEAQPRWRKEMCMLDEGLVDWTEAVRELRRVGYDGPLSVHGEYTGVDTSAEVLRRAVRDVEHLRECLTRAAR